jgi:type II secretory pathway component PulC
MSAQTSLPSSSRWVTIIACVVAVAGLTVGVVSQMEVQTLRAEVAALKARPEPTQQLTPQPAGPLDLSPWAELPAGEAIHLQRAELDVEALGRGCRVVPAFEQGRAIGFKLFGIREDSVFARLGLQNTDVVVAINGMRLDSPEHAEAVAEAVRTATALNISVRHRGTAKRIDAIIE